jgi:prophage antirepressor-like protein
MYNKKETPPVTSGVIEVFNFSQEKAPIRVQLIKGEPWFVAKDVCQVLGIANHKDAVSRLDDDEKDGVGITDLIGRQQTVTVVSESGLYHLIFQSRKPEARKFRRWVTSEVLPSIRRKGFYIAGKTSGDFIDARDIPYTKSIHNGCAVRMVEVNGSCWFSINDLNRSIGSRTESAQSARKLNTRLPLAVKVWLYGATQPGWFTNSLGARLLLCASRDTQCGQQLTLDF